MTDYKYESAGASAGNYQTANAPIYTVPSEEQRLSTNQSVVPIPSAPAITEFPPNYFDISIVPNNAVLHYNEVPPYTDASKAIVERKSSGVLSFDPLIDRNPDQLWLYFMTYLNEKPTLALRIHGYHTEVFFSRLSLRINSNLCFSIIRHTNVVREMMVLGILSRFIILVKSLILISH